MANAKNTPAVKPVTPAAAHDSTLTVADTADATICTMLDNATTAAKSADELARHAARAAWTSGAFANKLGIERANALQGIYRDHLSNDTVRVAFSASLAMLAYGRNVVIAAASIADISGGRIQTKGIVPVVKGSVLPLDSSGKQLPTRELSADATLDALSKSDLTAVAKMVRGEMGVARAAGAGRKPGSGNKAGAPTRAPFADEMSAMLRDMAGQTVLKNIAAACGFTLVSTAQFAAMQAAIAAKK